MDLTSKQPLERETPSLSSVRLAATSTKSCAWRIRKSSQKQSGAGSLVRCRHRATVHVDDAPAHTLRPPAGHHCQTRAPGRSMCCRGRILVDKAAVAHQQPRAAAGAEPEFVRSLRFGSWVTVGSGKPNP